MWVLIKLNLVHVYLVFIVIDLPLIPNFLRWLFYIAHLFTFLMLLIPFFYYALLIPSDSLFILSLFDVIWSYVIQYFVVFYSKYYALFLAFASLFHSSFFTNSILLFPIFSTAIQSHFISIFHIHFSLQYSHNVFNFVSEL